MRKTGNGLQKWKDYAELWNLRTIR